LTEIKEEYESLIIIRLPGKLCHPNKVSLIKMGILAKGKSWET